MSVFGDDDERLFPPTPRRREEARRSGRVAHSRLLATALVMLVAFGALRWGGKWLWHGVHNVAERPWTSDGSTPGAPAVVAWTSSIQVQPLLRVRELLTAVGGVVAPWLVLIVVLAIVANIAQFGFLFRPERLAERWEQPLSPASGGFGRRLRDALFALAQVAVIVGVAAWRLEPIFRGSTLRGAVDDSSAITRQSPAMDLDAWGAAVADAVLETGLYASGMLVVLGIVDYGWNWWRLERSLWMTTEEMREELRSDSARSRPRRRTSCEDGDSNDNSTLAENVPRTMTG
jgi:flagellar biosynthetic protein FlhB